MLENSASLLIVEDDETFGRLLARSLERRGFNPTICTQVETVVTTARTISAKYIVLDLNLDGNSGLELIEPLLKLNPDIHIVVLTGYASITTAVQAIKLGAHEYLTKPAEPDHIEQALRGQLPSGEKTTPAQPMSVKRLEWEHLQRVLQECNGNISEAARQMNMHRRTLQRKLQKRPVKL